MPPLGPFRWRRLGLLTGLLACLFLATAGAQRWLARIQLEDEQTHLETFRGAARSALGNWQRELLGTVQLLARDPALVAAVKGLLHDQGRNVPAARSRHLEAAQEWYRGLGRLKDFEGFFVVGPGDVNLASTRPANLGLRNLLAQGGDVLPKGWDGEAFLTAPQPSDVPLSDAEGRLVLHRPTMFVGAPIPIDDEVAALLLLRIDPYLGLYPLLSSLWAGRSGDAYLVRADGRLASPARFAETLRPAAGGLVASAVFDTRVDQEGRLARFLASADRGGPALGVSIEPYDDYRGEPVAGAWSWDPATGTAIVVERDQTEVMAPIEASGELLWAFALVVTLLLSAGMAGIQAYGDRVRRQQEEHERVEELARTKSGFLARMSHEIRTPMNGVLGTLQSMERGRLGEEEREQIDLATESALSLLVVLNDLLDFSKIEAGELAFESIDFDLPRLLERTRALFQETAAARGDELVVRCDAALPAAVRGDMTRLAQVLNNLVSNAVKFTSDGTVTLCAEPTPGGHRVRFSVTDTGAGIPADRQEAIFAEFVQADASTSRTHGGTGLGLAICRRLVEGMGGTLELDSVVGRGSTFHFSLPLEPARGPVGGGVTGEVDPAQLEGMRVLVVDDNEVNRRVARAMLKKLGCATVLVGSGPEALELLSGDAPVDVVLMDIEMPGMDGFEATRRIRRDLGSDVPVVALTAHALAEFRERCLAAGMDDFLSKPFRAAALAETLARVDRRVRQAA